VLTEETDDTHEDTLTQIQSVARNVAN